jgi:hypothetical protein
MPLEKLTQDDLSLMARNKTDHVYRESHMEWLVGILRQLHSMRTVVQYYPKDDAQYIEAQRRLKFIESKRTEEEVADALANVVQLKMKHGSRKPAEVKQLLEYPHTQKVLMELVSFGLHFRQDETVWNLGTLSRHFHNVNGGVSREAHIYYYLSLITTMLQFISNIVGLMVQVLHGLCRNVAEFEQIEDVKSRMTDLIKLTKAISGQLRTGKLPAKEAESLQSRLKQVQSNRRDLWWWAVGAQNSEAQNSEEPELSVLEPGLLEEWDRVYVEVFRPGVVQADGTKKNTVKSILTKEELTISCVTPSEMDFDDVEELREMYRQRMKDATRKYVVKLDESAYTAEQLSLFRQMEGKLTVLLQWSWIGANEMPIMPMLTRSLLRMILNRFEGIEDASRKVSVFITTPFHLLSATTARPCIDARTGGHIKDIGPCLCIDAWTGDITCNVQHERCLLPTMH